MKTLPRMLAIALTAATFAGRGPALAAAADDPCTTIPRGAVSEAIGLPVVSVNPTRTRDRHVCTFMTGRRSRYASISAYRFGSVPNAASHFRTFVRGGAASVGVRAASVSHLGDEAASLAGLLYVRKGTAIYVFGVVDGSPQPLPIVKAEKIARLAIPGITP